MFKFISKKIIKNYNDYNNPKVREQYGMLCSIVSIACNIVLVNLQWGLLLIVLPFRLMG